MTNMLKLPNDWSAIKKLIWLKAHPAMRDSGVEQTVSGSVPLAFSHAKTTPMEHLITNIKPVQDLHGYDAPWPAGGGKNKANITNETIEKPSWYAAGWNGTTVNSNGGITQTRTYSQGGAGGFVAELPAGSYVFSMEFTGTALSCKLYVSSWDGTTATIIVQNETMLNDGNRYYYGFTVPSDSIQLAIRPTIQYAEAVTYDLNKIQIEAGSSTPTSYAPYANICPISGWQGAEVYIEPTYDPTATPKASVTFGVLSTNQWDETWETGDLSSTDGSETGNDDKIRSYYIPVVGGRTYYAAVDDTLSNYFKTVWYDKNKAYINGENIRGRTRTAPDNAAYLRFSTQNTYGGTYRNDIAINYPDTVTTYNPYTDTIYGGTLDLATGDGTIDTASVDMGDLEYSFTSTRPTYKSFTISNLSTVYTEDGNDKVHAISSEFKPISYNDDWTINSIAPNNARSNQIRVVVPTDISTVEELKTYVTGLQLVYELAAPIPFHIDGLSIKPLKGDNNVWTDCGDTISVTYMVNAPVKTLEVTGDPPLYLPLSVGKPLKSWEVDVIPYQDLHGYDAPWPAGGGKNKFDYTAYQSWKVESGITFTVNTDGTVHAIGTSTSRCQIYWRLTNAFAKTLGGFVIDGFQTNITGFTVMLEQAGGDYTQFASQTSGTGATISSAISEVTTDVNFIIRCESGVTIDSTFYPMIRPADSTHDYAPYSNICQTTGTSKTESEVTWTVNDDGTISVSGTATGYSSFVVGTAKVDSSMGYITISGIGTATNIVWSSVILQDDNDNTVYTITTGSSALSFTVDMSQYPTATKVYVSVKRNNNVATSGVVKPMVEFGSTASDFTPYVAPSSTAITLPSTVYTGTVGSEGGDKKSGKITLNGSEEWKIGGSGEGFWLQFNTLKKLSDYRTAIMCESLKTYRDRSQTAYKTAVSGITGYYTNSFPTQNWLYAKGGGATTVDEFKAWLAENPITVVYELATPTEFAVPSSAIPTNDGDTYAWATSDSGTVDDMTVTYKGHVMPE